MVVRQCGWAGSAQEPSACGASVTAVTQPAGDACHPAVPKNPWMSCFRPVRLDPLL